MNRDEFITRSKNIHNDRYDYTKVNYINNLTKVRITCPIHGEFWQTPKLHMKGSGCPKCSSIKRGNNLRDTKEEFVKKSINIHGNKYDYSKVEYINSRTPVCIICPIHGEFYQSPTRHLNSTGCNKCAIENKNITLRSSKEEFVKKCKEKYGNRYNYDKLEYINSRTPICVTCAIHGDFNTTPHKLLHSGGCPKCMIEKNKNKKVNTTKEEEKICKLKEKEKRFIDISNLLHNNRYDYSKVEYKKRHGKVCIICPVHGEFWQTPNNHLKGSGCPKCAKDEMANKYAYSTSQFIERARSIHGNKYDYSKVKYVNNRTKVCIICPEHGEFYQTPSMHCNDKQGCPLCGTLSSKDENEIAKILSNTYNINIQQREHSLIKPLELDIYLPDYKIAIEYNGLRWHSDKFGKSKKYHYNKMIRCNENGIKLMTIFSDEYINNKDIVIDKILRILDIDTHKDKIYNNECDIKEISKSDAEHFLNVNNIQGFIPSTIYLGCLYKDNIIAVMSFKTKRNNKDKWKLSRFATDISKYCIGVEEKIFEYFIIHYKPSEIESLADRRWTLDVNDNFYTKLGFKLNNILPPDYQYYYKKEFKEKRINKFKFRKEVLHKNILSSMTEKELCDKIEAYKIWDCGSYRYVWNNNNNKKVYNDNENN